MSERGVVPTLSLPLAHPPFRRRLQGAAALSTTSAVQKAKPKPLGDPDEYIFREHCKGTRVLSKEAQETTER